jgi:Fe-S cluster assembly protein SufD
MTELSYKEKTSIARYSDESVARDPNWLANLRSRAMTRFAEIGFPTRRDEDWRSTPIAPIVETPFVLAGPAGIDSRLLDGKHIEGAIRIVVVNGRIDASASDIPKLPRGATVGSLSDAVATDDPTVREHLGKLAKFDREPFVALNTASIGDGGVFIGLGRGVVIETGDEPTVSHPRFLVVAGENSQATIIERFVGPADCVYLTNAVAEFAVADGANIDHYKVQQESRAAYHVATIQADLGRASNFSSQSFGFGASIARNDANAILGGDGGCATLNGLFLAHDRQLMDSHTVLDHAMPNCPSHQLYKHILDGNARAVFNGKIFVRLDAQKTDAKQTNQTLLLSKDAQIDTKPQLEIFADDVRCTHGATVGQLRDDQLFYLRARGIGLEQARELLIYAFASEIIQRIKIEPLKDELDAILLSERHIEGLALEKHQGE